jgi:serine/threonine protein kinase/Tol biopolymer transport system component
MEPEHWRRIEDLYHAAREQEEGERARFLAEACAGDEALRREVESLLAQEESAKHFMEAPALEAAAKGLGAEVAATRPAGDSGLVGRTISHYRVLELLGRGGMGVVYKARDTKLGRLVALKFLQPAWLPSGTSVLAGRSESTHLDPQALERFKREARTASALNHPHICTVFEIDEFEGEAFMAMEYLEGQTLKERIQNAKLENRKSKLGAKENFDFRVSNFPSGPLRVDEVLDLAIQIADGLEAAHSKGIIHRDLKPANVFITTRGDAKILDFGLAKLTQPLPSEDGGLAEIASPSEARRALAEDEHLTKPGVTVGTAAYMSPEQARGEPLDARTDLFSFGVVLYEMATGTLPFQGKTSLDAFAALLREEPRSVLELQPDLPAELDRIVSKALEKDRDMRSQSAAEMRAELKRLRRDTESGRIAAVAAVSGRRAAMGTSPLQTRRALSFSIATLALAAILAGIAYSIYRLAHRRAPSGGAAMKIAQLTTSGHARKPAISPDGKYVVYEQDKDHQTSLWLYQVATGTNVQIVAPIATGMTSPAFSRDGNYVYYIDHDNDHPKGILCKVASLGGAPRKLFENLSSSVSFSPDGKRLAFVRRLPEGGEYDLMAANEDGSEEKQIHRFLKPKNLWNDPAWAPDGKTIALTVHTDPPDNHARLEAVSVEDGGERLIGSHVWSTNVRPTWLPDGSGLVTVAGELNSPDEHQIYEISYPEGEARRITVDLSTYGGMGVTADGNSLVTAKQEFQASLMIASMDKAGHPVEDHVLAGSDGTEGLDWTPEGRIVYTASTASEENLGSMDASGGDRKQLTALGVDGEYIEDPSVCGDGRHIVAQSNHGGNMGLLRINSDGSNLVQLTREIIDGVASCSPDGKWVVFQSNRTGTWTLWKVSIDGGEQTQLTKEDTEQAAVSPDGKWIACLYYPHNATRQQIAILPFAGRAPVKILDSDGAMGKVRWTRDGRSLTYAAYDGLAENLWNQPIDGGPPRKITNYETGGIFSFAWSRDGKRLAVVRGSRSWDVVMISNFRARE